MARRMLTEEEKAQKQRVILRHALELFAAHGYEATTMGQIADAVDLSTGTLYLYFASKQEIYTTLCMEALDKLDESFDDAFRMPAPDIRTRIYLLLYSYINFYKNQYPYYRVMNIGLMEEKKTLPEKEEALVEKGLSIIKKLEAPVVEGVMHGVLKPCDTFKTVVSMWVMFDGVLQLPHKPYVEALDWHLEAYYTHCIEIILNGILL